MTPGDRRDPAGPAITIQRAGDRFVTLTEWSQTRHSFSFGAHYDPGNVGFGALMVHNDDLVSAGSGYPDHPHRDAEIVTWVLSGSLVHADSAGHHGIVVPGLAQRMSAGSGIVHAERNDAFRLDPTAPEVPVHLVQMWVRPDRSGGEPSYAQAAVDPSDQRSGWVPVASGTRPDAAVPIGSAGSTLWVTSLAPGEQRVLPTAPRLHVYLARGAVTVSTVGALGIGDALRVVGEAALTLTATADAEILVWELAG